MRAVGNALFIRLAFVPPCKRDARRSNLYTCTTANMPMGGRATRCAFTIRCGCVTSEPGFGADVAQGAPSPTTDGIKEFGTKDTRGGNHALETCLGARSGLFILNKRAHHLSERVRRTLLEPTLRWHAVAVSPRWRLTRPDADAAHAEPSPGADLKSDPVRNWLAAQAPATGAARRRQDHDMLRGASIDAIGLVTGR